MQTFCRWLAGALLAGLVPAVALCATSGQPYHVGERERIYQPDHPRDWRGAQTEGLRVRIWYPADPDQAESTHAIGAPERPIFLGSPVAENAPLSSRHRRYPLLLLSHGTGGSADSLSWLGTALAAQGYIVAAVNHPGNNGLEPLTAEGFLLWWERATDISDVLDGMLRDRAWNAHIDARSIGAVGFSLGGYTVLELAGARTHRQALERFCRSPAADAICHPPEARELTQGKDLALAPSPQTAASLAHSDDSYRDPRIKAVFAIAPALGEAFDRASFADVHIPVALLAGSADTTAPVATNVQRIAGFLPSATFTLLPGARHYTFVDICAPAIAGKAFFCQDGIGVDRAAMHGQAIAKALAFFSGNLARTPAHAIPI